MNEFMMNPTVQAVLQVLAAIGAVCLIRLFQLRVRKAYLEWRENQDKLDKIPLDFREHVLERLQVLIDSRREVTIQTVYEILDGPGTSNYIGLGCQFSVDYGVDGECFIVNIFNDKWLSKLLVPTTIPIYWGENDWPLNLAVLNQCRTMVRITY